MVHEWRDHLVDQFLYCVKHENIWSVRMAAHNLAVYLATGKESCEELRVILVRGAGADRVMTGADYDEYNKRNKNET